MKNCTFRVFPPFRQRYFGQGGIDKTVTTKRNRYPFLNLESQVWWISIVGNHCSRAWWSKWRQELRKTS